MKKTLTLAATLFLLFGVVVAQPIKKVKIADVLHIADTSTVPIVINFFATWCRPCVQELPWFEKTVPNYKDKKVKLLLVSLDYADDYPKGIAAFAKKHDINSQIVWLDESDPNFFCPKVDKRWEGTIPVSLMINNATRFRAFYDYQLPEGQLKMALDKLVQ
jgi:thiol-disulfide isomerase/thioredoxin